MSSALPASSRADKRSPTGSLREPIPHRRAPRADSCLTNGNLGLMTDRGPHFDGVKIGRPATGALLDAGYGGLADLPEDLSELLSLHGVGPRAVRILQEARMR